MSTVTVRIPEKTDRQIKQLAQECDATKTQIIQKAIDVYQRQLYFEKLNSDFAALKADPEAWKEELAERRIWDATLADGLEDE
jgi:predicted transcriptional regulator